MLDELQRVLHAISGAHDGGSGWSLLQAHVAIASGGLFGTAGQPGCGHLHDRAESLMAFGFDLGYDRPHLRLDFGVTEAGRHVGAQDRHLSLFLAGRFVTAGFAVNVDRLLAPPDLLASDLQYDFVVQGAGCSWLLACAHDLDLEQRESAELVFIAMAPRLHQLGLEAIEKCHFGDCFIWTDRR